MKALLSSCSSVAMNEGILALTPTWWQSIIDTPDHIYSQSAAVS